MTDDAAVTGRMKYVEWKDIAKALGMSIDSAQRAAARNVDPLPVRYNHGHSPYIRHDSMSDWVDRNDLPHNAYHALRKRGLLPHQGDRSDATCHECMPRRKQKPSRDATQETDAASADTGARRGVVKRSRDT